MRKKVFGKHLSRDTDTRKALFRSLVRSLILHDSVVTTKTKAKAIQGSVDTLVRLAQEQSTVSQRKIYARLANDRLATSSLIARVSGFTKERTSGFTRLINLPARRGDRAAMVRMEWVEKGTFIEKEPKKSDKKLKKTAEVKEKKSLGSKILKRPTKKATEDKSKKNKK